MQNIPSWDLSDLFTGIDDPKVDQTLNKSLNSAKNFQKKYRGNLKNFVEPSKMLEVLKEYEYLASDAILPQAYGAMVLTVDSISPENGNFLQKVQTETAEIFSYLTFFELELGNFSEKEFNDLIGSSLLLQYKHYFEKILAWKPYRLSEAEEKMSDMKELTGKHAMNRLFEQELSRQKFEMKLNGKEVQMNESEILNLLHTGESQQIRAAAASSFTKGLLQKESVLTFVMNTLAEDKKIDDKLRGFSFPEQSRHLRNEAAPTAIEAMAGIVEDNYSLVQEYYKFKKEVLGLEKLYDYDRYAALNTKETKYSFADAEEIVLDAFGNFNPEFADIIKNFFEKKWIDAAVKHGKRGGAYCEGATPEMHPYVLMNFTGSANDVMTLAHELGHGINFELSRKQTLLNYNQPLTLAETASIFAETLTFARLVENTKDKDVLLGLYMHKIEGIFASVFRQISMYRFEQDFHNAYRKKGELSVAEINNFWRDRQSKMFGDSIVLTPDYDNWWMYISHFVHTPFYVYAYAFGELLALGLFSRKDEEHFFEKYKEFLEAGGSQSPNELAKIFDINLEDRKFWKDGIEIIKQYLEKAKVIHSEMS